MRWKPKPSNRPKLGESRIRTFFAWLPMQSRSTKEYRWLEKVTVEEDYNILYWDVRCFIDPEPQESNSKTL